MDVPDSALATADELTAFALREGVDLGPYRAHFTFQGGRRWVIFWRKQAGVPGSGRPDEAEGTLRYSMQGPIMELPAQFSRSAGAFKGGWSESGRLQSLEQAIALVVAWVVNRSEVDDLPSRETTRRGI